MSTDPIVEQIEHLPKTWSPEAGAVNGETQTSATPPVPAPVPPTTTTVATVTTTTTPAAGAVPWAQSLKFRAYLGGWLTLLIGWAIENITTHQFVFNTWTWIALSVSTLLTARAIVADWMNPAVTAPFAIMNKANVS